MPTKSEAQERLMEAAAHTEGGYGDVPQSVGEEFVKSDGHNETHEAINELSIAKAIRSGELESHQQYENIYLFDVRITGTGTSYRKGLDEYVFRSPDIFLTDEFVERCNGLPLIFEHPDKNILNTDEFRNRSIGVIILPYIKGDEVWGIAKVFDDDAANLMVTSHASTSPAVVFRDAGSTETIEIDGNSVLIEGTPSYLDHLAICESGVWDKGGEPNGINNSKSEEPEMDEKDEKIPAWADALMSRMDSFESKKEEEEKEEAKADAEEKDEKDEKDEEAKADAEPEKAKEEIEQVKKDGEDKKKAEEKAVEYADSTKRDSEMKAQIEALQRQLASFNQPLSNADRDALSSAQARADSVAQMFGDSVNAPLHGESPIAYRQRLASKFQKHSKDFKDVKLDSLQGPTFDMVEGKIYADAQSAALEPSNMPAGRLMPIMSRDSSGREITRYAGDIAGFINQFASTGAICKLNKFQKGA